MFKRFLTEERTVRSEKFACERTNAITKSDSSVVCVNSVEEAVDYLEQTQKYTDNNRQ